MGFVRLFLIALGLSMDAFAVSVCKGLSMRRMNWRQALVIGLFFGGFQAVMPLVGWGLGRQFERFITAYDHWIAFALLVFIGAKMIYEALKPEEGGIAGDAKMDVRELFMLAVATSVDALAVGISFAFLRIDIVPSALLIGVTTFSLSVLGVRIGSRLGDAFTRKAEIAGGIVLVLMGVWALVENLV